MIRNTDHDLVNGTLGRVIAFDRLPPEDGVQSTEVDNQDSPRFPLVSFRLADGCSREVLVYPQNFKVALPSGEIRASRSQASLFLTPW
jgi:ATP-dependent DNA helicase PIF1